MVCVWMGLVCGVCVDGVSVGCVECVDRVGVWSVWIGLVCGVCVDGVGVWSVWIGLVWCVWIGLVREVCG